MASKGKSRVFVVGVGMTNFEKPGRRNWDYPDMAKIAITQALEDAQLPYNVIEQVCCGYCYGDSTCGQRAVYSVGLTGVPVYNVNNNCSTGSTALFMAKQFVEGGMSECVLAVGFEKMERGSLGAKFQDRTNPMDKHMTVMMEARGLEPAPPTSQLFGNAGREHMEKYGTKLEHFAKIAEKNHRHSANNPRSQFKKVYSLDQIMKSKKVFNPLTKLQCCPTSDGAAAAIVCSEKFVYQYGLQKNAVEIVGMSMVTDMPSTFKEKSMINLVGYKMTEKAANDVYKQSGLNAKDVQVIELHDCFSANELITYEALGLCPPGKAGELIDRGDNTYGGKWVVNPSGGLISKGHPLGATGLAQCAELSWQLRGLADKRQVQGAQVALQHNLGLGGAAVVAMYKKPEFPTRPKFVRAAPVNASPSPTSAGGSSSSFQSDAVFQEMSKRVNADLVSKVGVVYQFIITDGSKKKSWIVDLKNGSGSVKEASGSSDCSITIADSDYIKLMNGKLDPMQAFMQGKLKIKGNMMLAQKLNLLMGQASKL